MKIIGYKQQYWAAYPANIYLFKVNMRNIRKGQEICSKLTKRKQQNDVIDAILIFYC